MKLILGIGLGIAGLLAAQWVAPHMTLTSSGLSCDAPSGAMHAIEYKEMFIGKMHDFKFSCVPMLRGICSGYFCTEFTAIDADNKHVIGYVWRDVWNKPKATTCSPDGGRSGTFYGECPVGTSVATVYECPWCEPNLNDKADTRGKRSSLSE